MECLELVSIITPTYNCGRFIADTINSVLAQTYHNWEMIIVDDCSTDDTKDVVSQFNDPRIKYYCLDHNSGAAIARNTALSMAKGRWIAFLDSDDMWFPRKLELQIKFMIQNSYAFTYHEYFEINESGIPLHKKISGPKRITRNGMLAYCWPGCLTVMYDRRIIGNLQIPDIKKNNDYAMWLIISKKNNCLLLNESLAYYRKRSGSISNHNYLSLLKWHISLFEMVERRNMFCSVICTINNVIWGILKKVVYVKNI